MTDAPDAAHERFVTWKQALYGVCAAVVVLAGFAGVLISKVEASEGRQGGELLELRREIATRLSNIENILLQRTVKGGR